MNNSVSALVFLTDAEIILEESRFSLERGHWHRVVRKSQEATELAIKGLFKYLGLDYPKSHILGKVIKKELGKHRLFDKEVLNQIAFISDSLAFDREPSFYGSFNGLSASSLFDKDDAEEALKNSEWVIGKIKSVIS
jgi:hypothetical protein